MREKTATISPPKSDMILPATWDTIEYDSREESRVLVGSLTSEHGLDATRMWQAQRQHAAFARGLTPGSLQDPAAIRR